MKFEFIHKIAIINGKFLVLLNLLQSPNIIHSGGRILGLCIPAVVKSVVTSSTILESSHTSTNQFLVFDGDLPCCSDYYVNVCRNSHCWNIFCGCF